MGNCHPSPVTPCKFGTQYSARLNSNGPSPLHVHSMGQNPGNSEGNRASTLRAGSGWKNVLRKLLRIPCRRLKAGFSVCWLCSFGAGVLSEMHEVRTFAPCKAFFYLICLLFFGRLKITLDSGQPMLKEKQIIPSVWGGIKGFAHFLKGEYFFWFCIRLIYELISQGWIKTRSFSICC